MARSQLKYSSRSITERGPEIQDHWKGCPCERAGWRKSQSKYRRSCFRGLSLPRTAVFEIRRQDLQMWFLLSNWVPNELTKNNKMQQVTSCEALIQSFNQYQNEFLGSNLFIQDQTWVHWDSKTHREVWASQGGKKPTSPRPRLTTRKTTALVGLTYRSKRFSVSILPPNTTADSHVMTQFLKDAGHWFYTPQEEQNQAGNLLLMWDNTKFHVALETGPRGMLSWTFATGKW